MPKLSKSTRPGKKYQAKFENKTVHFGASGYRDRTKIKNKEERDKAVKAYKSRHKNDNLNDKMSPGALSYYVLWGGDTISAGIAAYNKRFNENMHR